MKNNNFFDMKKIFYTFGVCIFILVIVVIEKSYAIYKLEEQFNLLETKINTFNNPDILISALVDGKETSEFPSYETNYKVESIDCTNGVVASWDIENWELRVADMKSTSTKCTVNFDSTKKNEIEPINMSKSELVALNSEYQSMAYDKLKTQLLNDTYPVGSIYMSTEDDTVEKVQNKFGGTWVKYSEGRTLVGANDSYSVNSTGGSSSVTIGVTNLPNHEHTTVSTTISGGAHTHSVSGLGFTGEAGSSGQYGVTWGNYSPRTLSISSSGSHSHTVPSLKTNSCTNCSGSSLNILNPYIVVYMYKRTA